MIWLKLAGGARCGLRAAMVPFELMLLARRLAGGSFLTDLASVGNKEMDLFLKAVMAVCDMAATRVQQTLDIVKIFSGSEGLSRDVSRLGLVAGHLTATAIVLKTSVDWKGSCMRLH